MNRLQLPLVIIVLFSIVSTNLAGEVTLKNGDRVSGEIVDETAEIVVVNTPYAGKISIDKKHVAKIVKTAANAVTKPVAAAIPPKSDSTTAKSENVVKRTSNNFAGHVRRVMTGWEGNANIGFSYTSGNSNNITMATGLRATKTRPNDGFTIYARSLWNSNHGAVASVTTQNAFWGGARYDRTIDKKLFGFVSYDFERDKPRRLQFRSVAGAGLGHRTIKNERTELEIFVGGAWNRTWQANLDSDTPEALAGFTFKQRINDKLRFQNAMTYFQNVTDRTEYRMILDATITVDVTKKVGFFISIGDRFNNDPLGHAERNDFLFTTGMKWNFGKKR